MSIRVKILIACLIMAMSTLALGLFSLRTSAALGSLAMKMYDQSFMSVNFVRAAQVKYTILQGSLAAAPMSDAAARTSFSALTDDLDIAIERASSLATRDAATKLRATLAIIAGQRGADTADKLAGLASSFDDTVELFAQDGFEQRSVTELTLADAATSTWVAIAGSGMIALLATAALSQTIVPQTRRAASIATAIANGRLDNVIAVPRWAGRSETAILLRALTRMQDAIIANLSHIEGMRAAEATRRDEADAARRADLNAMAEKVEDDTKDAVAQFSVRTDAMSAAASRMATLADQTGENARAAAQAAEQSMARVQNVAAAAEELATSISAIGTQAEQSAITGREAIIAGHAARSSIDALTDRITSIGGVVAIITEIANRTNLLALNATIEAARAGAAGKGFAVVATEVKALAQQTAQSTRAIGDHINDVRAATEAAVESVHRMEGTVVSMGAMSGQISDAIDAQREATAEIARNVAETATVTETLAQLVAEVSGHASATLERAGHIRGQSLTLAQSIIDLQHRVVQVIRGSTVEVDRRQHPRFTINAPARLRLHGRPETEVRLVDISDGGANIAMSPPAPTSATGMLIVPNLDMPLPVEVVTDEPETAGGTLHLRFGFDDQQRQAFAGFAARLRNIPADQDQAA